MLEKFINHPEVDDYGLTLNFGLWSELNKEILMRNWIKSSRDCYLYRSNPEVIGIEAECGTDSERKLAERALDELIDKGYLNEITYTKTPKAYM